MLDVKILTDNVEKIYFLPVIKHKTIEDVDHPIKLIKK